ncbi:right-handed parallel beta-helix repeat-containing protein [Herbiconiux sp. 11R-BC]|uniref:right-handed parallel beta-helix repeat-containing protein n=1 Tax=Herbiconiux sp. 11R-BC TaxID=3111637 RepID=UPI003BFAE37F
MGVTRASIGVLAVGTVLLLAAVSGCATAGPASAPASAPASCPSGTLVSTASGLTDALAAATPGTTVVLADGRYEGRFTVAVSGTAAAPITLCGASGAVLDGGGTDSGYTLHLQGASHWRLEGFSVSGGQKGVMLDGSSSNALTGLTVSGTGDEAVHLRAGSSDNLVEKSTISGTGRSTAEFGEGVYVGSAQSNWCTISACDPDRSDRNRISGNTISGTTAEAIDVKEGTTGGQLLGNALDGSAATAVDSLIDVKGSDWVVSRNTGTAAPKDGAQVHVILDGWGARNAFDGNSFAVAASGYAVSIVGDARAAGNQVACDNRATVAGADAPGRATNVTCVG